jgi:hypothetical protein
LNGFIVVCACAQETGLTLRSKQTSLLWLQALESQRTQPWLLCRRRGLKFNAALSMCRCRLELLKYLIYGDQ